MAYYLLYIMLCILKRSPVDTLYASQGFGLLRSEILVYRLWIIHPTTNSWSELSDRQVCRSIRGYHLVGWKLTHLVLVWTPKSGSSMMAVLLTRRRMRCCLGNILYPPCSQVLGMPSLGVVLELFEIIYFREISSFYRAVS